MNLWNVLCDVVFELDKLADDNIIENKKTKVIIMAEKKLTEITKCIRPFNFHVNKVANLSLSELVQLTHQGLAKSSGLRGSRSCYIYCIVRNTALCGLEHLTRKET